MYRKGARWSTVNFSAGRFSQKGLPKQSLLRALFTCGDGAEKAHHLVGAILHIAGEGDDADVLLQWDTDLQRLGGEAVVGGGGQDAVILAAKEFRGLGGGATSVMPSMAA